MFLARMSIIENRKTKHDVEDIITLHINEIFCIVYKPNNFQIVSLRGSLYK